MSDLAVHVPHARIGNVDTSLIDRSVHFDLVVSEAVAQSNIGGSNPARAASKLVKRIVKEVAAILAQDGFPVDHCRIKLLSAVPSHPRFKDALTFVLDAPDIDQKQSGTRTPPSLPNHAPPAFSHDAPKPSSVLGNYSSSFGSTLFSALSRSSKAAQESERLQQERWHRHLDICQACRDDVARKGDKQFSSSAGSVVDAPPSRQSGPLVSDGTSRVVAVFSIGGMTCASCAQSITAALQSDDSIPIDSIQVNVMSASAAVTTHPSSVDRVAEAIEDAGFEAQVVRTEPVPRSAARNAQSDGPHWRGKLSIHGMTCASCVRSITSALESYANQTNSEHAIRILETSVNLMAKSADIKLSAEAAVGKAEVEKRLQHVVGEIEDIGFDAELLSVQHIQGRIEDGGLARESQDNGSQQRSVRIRIDGMFCQHCVSKVRDYFDAKKQNHASDIEVNDDDLEAFTLSKPFLRFSYTSGPDSQVRLRDVLAELNQLDPAFEATFSPPPSLASRSAVLARKELQDLLIRLSLTAVFVVPALVISMIAPVLAPTHALRRILSQYVVGSATKGQVAMWIISTPVQFGVGSIFFKKAWRSLFSVWKKGRSRTDRFLRFGNMDVLVALGTLVAYTSSLAFLILDAFRQPPGQSTFRALALRIDGTDDPMPDEMGMTYFEVSVFLVFFILLGRALESISKKKTGDAVADLSKMKPSSAYLVIDRRDLAQSKTEVVDVALLEVGDYVLVPCGASPPLDGIFAGTPTGKGESVALLDESSLSGEARPVSKAVGDPLYAGTANVSPTAIFARVRVLPGSCMIDDILDVVQESAGKKASIAQLADKITGVFVPVIVYISLSVFVLWTLLLYLGALSEAWQASNVPHYGEPGARLLWALQFGISCLLVACPCGIGLAAPTSQLAGIGLASKHGILVNGGGEAFRAASAAVRGSAKLVVVFDKTGTITKGEAVKVTAYRFAPALEQGADPKEGGRGLTQDVLLRCIDLVEQSSTHPYAGAVRGFVSERLKQAEASAPSPLPKLVDVAEVAGKGIRASFEAKSDGSSSSFSLLIGNKRLMDEIEGANARMDESVKVAEHEWAAAANSVVYVGFQRSSSAGEIALALAVSDEIRPEAAWVISHLEQRFDAEVWMVSGDNEATAKGVASQVGVDGSRVVAGVLPVQKKEWVERLQRGTDRGDVESGSGDSLRNWWRCLQRTDSNRPRTVCFVGDGINDSPALSSASLGIALGSGSSIAHSSSDFILLRRTSPLLCIPLLLRLSEATYRKIWTNFAWAFVFNLCLVPVAAGALVCLGVRLGPALSGLAMAFSSTSVVLNSLTLRWWRPDGQVRTRIAQAEAE